MYFCFFLFYCKSPSQHVWAELAIPVGCRAIQFDVEKHQFWHRLRHSCRWGSSTREFSKPQCCMCDTKQQWLIWVVMICDSPVVKGDCLVSLVTHFHARWGHLTQWWFTRHWEVERSERSREQTEPSRTRVPVLDCSRKIEQKVSLPTAQLPKKPRFFKFLGMAWARHATSWLAHAENLKYESHNSNFL